MIRIRNIKLSLNEKENILKEKVSKKLKININKIKTIKINKKSLDARNKNNICYVYELDVKVENESKILTKIKSKDIFKTPNEVYKCIITGEKSIQNRPIIVGSGPSGLFAAYLLAEHGYKPLIIERGENIEDREKTVDKFWKTGLLNTSSNVQFGEGGAGTFSDGKLNTLVKDKNYRMKKVFETFVSCGAPKEIMYENNPHIGTDILKNVIINMRNKIINMGGEFRFNTCLTDINIKNNQINSIVVNENEIIECNLLVLAIGHSARDTFKMLNKRNLIMDSKPFAVGVRVIHSQEMINKKQYGEKNYNKLPPANYKLTYTTSKGRGVYSFCMCPGGYVINSSSENNMLVINGMSNYKRDSGFANSAIVVTVSKDDFGQEIFSGLEFQMNLEQKAYLLGKGKIPVQSFNGYVENKPLGSINSSAIKGSYQTSNLNEIFPEYINEAIKEGMMYFDKKITDFASSNPILLGVESRTSSPIKIFRDENLMSNIKGIFPCGEGAGYAGGITTSAIDGIKVFESIAKIYRNK